MKNNSNQTNSSEKEFRLTIKGKSFTVSEMEEEIKNLEKNFVTKRDDVNIRRIVDDLIFYKTCLRENSITNMFEKFIDRKSETVKNAVYLNKSLLRCAVQSYYDDIHRYKDYSGSMWANGHKQAAYTIKWIVKFKPIQINKNFDNEETFNNEIADINLTFALRCAFSFLDRASVDLISNEKKEVDKYNSLPEEERKEGEKQSFYDKLLYNLRYRSFSGKQLVSIFEALELQCSKTV